MAHVADRLQAMLSGAASPEEKAQADAHLVSCRACREERDLVSGAQTVIAPLPARDPRAGFAARVAAEARDRRTSAFSLWRRWVLGGVALGTAALAAAVVLAPRPDRLGGENAVLARRLDFFEDLGVLQNREALEDLEVVSVLHTLEARP